MLNRPSIVALALGVLFAAHARAEDTYYKVQLRSLALTEGALPADPEPSWEQWDLMTAFRPYAVLDREGEAYLRPREGGDLWGQPWAFNRDSPLLIRALAPGDLTGRLFVPKADLSGMVMVRFTVPAGGADPAVKSEFLEAREAHYAALLNREIPGAAWFRRQARDAHIARTGSAAGALPAAQRPDWRRRQNDLSDTYALFSGGRALSENLQLDRVLPAIGPGEETVALDSIEGITVQELDWTSLVKDARPPLDPLAAMVPADQHAIFLPTFEAAVRLADEAEAAGTPVLRLMEARSEDARTRERYQRQLCLSINALSRALGPQVIGSIAITGSDPSYRTGTDVAVIFEARNPAALQAMLLAQVAAAVKADPGARPVKGRAGGATYSGAKSDDRAVCSYVAQIGQAVVVTNSLHQLERLAGVQAGQAPAIASLDEYAFFRQRYRRDDPGETAFIFLSDATIRRWCGPRWRIANSRRTRDAAVMSELQARHMDGLARGSVQAGPLHTDLPVAQVGELRLTPRGVTSSVYNTLGFLTPIAEIGLDKVTKAEAEAYQRWRETYQRNWRQYFDPIGLRLGIDAGRVSADLTVMPLILGSQYQQFVELARGAAIGAQAGDRHDAVFHAIMAFNAGSAAAQQFGGLAAGMAPGIGANPLGWLGQSIALYADEDPFWQELAEVADAGKWDFLERNLHRLPVALHIEVKDQLRLAAFLTALRAFADQTAPGMAVWESLSHNGQAYVRVSPSEQGREEGGFANLAIHYAPSASSLIVTFNERVLKRALDRQAQRKGGAPNGPAVSTAGQPWLGSSLALRADAGAFEYLASLSGEQWRHRMRLRAWGNIPILNEWKRRYPDRDPVELHEALWQTRLVCPGGGSYAWNEQWQTMESTVFGSPAAPRQGPAAAPVIQSFSSGDFGISFEEHGLRARTELRRAPGPKGPG